MKSTILEDKLKNLVVFIFDLYYLALIISIIISVLLEKFTFYGTNFYKNDYMATSLIRSKINFYITIFIVSIRNLVFKEKVQKCIDDNKGKNFYSCHSDNVYFKQFDLKASVGHIDLYTSGRKIGEDHWKMYVTMEDVFDFDRWMNPTNKLYIANNLGYVMQRIGMLHTYSWDLDFEFEYEDGTIK